MSYVRANTSPTFGMRSQAETKMAPNLAGPFYGGPYPQYGQPELSRTRSTATRLAGNWTPAPPNANIWAQGAVTYHIDPRTGQYVFDPTQLLPRGLFQQTTFQHPVSPALSALGVPVSARGTSMVEIRGRRGLMGTSPTRRRGRYNSPLSQLGAALAGMFDGLSCSSCRKGMGVDECSDDSDCGPNGVCGGGVCLTSVGTAPQSVPVNGFCNATVDCQGALVCVNNKCMDAANAPATQLNQAVAVLENTLSSVNGSNAPNTFTPPTWFTSSTAFGGTSIPNMLLVGGGLIALVALTSGGKGR